MNGNERELTVCVSDGPSPVVRLSGQISFRNRDLVCQAFEKLIEDGHQVIGADMSELDYLDSSAVSALVKCAVYATDSGSIIEIVGASPHVSRILTLCGAAVFFKSRLPDVPSCSNPESGSPTRAYWHVTNFSLPATPAAASVARSRISALIQSLPLTTKDGQDLISAAGEAVSNAIKHGCGSNPDQQFTVKCVAGPSRVLMDIIDPGSGFNPDLIPQPAPASLGSGGMGILIMRQLMDEVSFDFSGRTRVRLVKDIRFTADTQTTLMRALL